MNAMKQPKNSATQQVCLSREGEARKAKESEKKKRRRKINCANNQQVSQVTHDSSQA